MVVKTAIGFLGKESDDQLIGSVQAALAGLTDNPNFPAPAPALKTVEIALTAFKTALAEAINRGKVEVAAKNARRAELVSLMRQLASYVTLTSADNMEILLSSGFPYHKPVRSRVGELPAPSAPYLRLGNGSGQLIATVQPLYGAGSYNWRAALASAPNTFVQTAQTIGGRATFKGLTPGQIYNVQVNAVGSAGPSDWSDMSTLMVV